MHNFYVLYHLAQWAWIITGWAIGILILLVFAELGLCLLWYKIKGMLRAGG